MLLTENIRKLAKQTTIVISIHTVILIICSYAHQKIDILYMMMDFAPILLILCLAPLVGVLFLSTPSARQGTIILLGVLPAEIIYNIVTRFTAIPPVTINEVDIFWKITYEFSFGLMLILEVIGFWLTLKITKEIHRQLNNPSE